MSVYMIAAVTILDSEQYKVYEESGAASLQGYEVEALAIGQPKLVEGTVPSQRVVLLKFKDQETFDRWRASPEYAAARPIRHATAETAFIFTLDSL